MHMFNRDFGVFPTEKAMFKEEGLCEVRVACPCREAVGTSVSQAHLLLARILRISHDRERS